MRVFAGERHHVVKPLIPLLRTLLLFEHGARCAGWSGTVGRKKPGCARRSERTVPKVCETTVTIVGSLMASEVVMLTLRPCSQACEYTTNRRPWMSTSTTWRARHRKRRFAISLLSSRAALPEFTGGSSTNVAAEPGVLSSYSVMLSADCHCADALEAWVGWIRRYMMEEEESSKDSCADYTVRLPLICPEGDRRA